MFSNLKEAEMAYLNELKIVRGYSYFTIINYQQALDSLIDIVGNKHCLFLNLKHIEQYRENLVAQGLSKKSQACKMVTIRGFVSYLRRHHLTVINFKSILVPKPDPPKIRWLYPSDIRKMVDAARRNKRDVALILTLFSSGIRVGELIRLNHGDIQNQHCTVLGKGNKIRLVFISSQANAAIQKYTRSCPFPEAGPLFKSRSGRRLSSSSVFLIVSKYAREAGLEDVSPHILRHSYATTLMREGVNIVHVQKLLGHSHVQTTSMYLHVVDDELWKSYKTHELVV